MEADTPAKDVAPDNRAEAEGEDRRVSPDPNPRNLLAQRQPIQETLDEYLDHLRRAQEEQEQLEERLERERLYKELGEPEQPPGEKSSQQRTSQYRLSLYSGNPPNTMHEDIIETAAALNTVPRDALVESIRPGTAEPIVEPHPPPSAAEDLPTQAFSTASQIPASSRTAQERSSPDHVEIQL